MHQKLTLREFLPSALTMLLTGWGGLILMIYVFQIPPVVWARWGFYVLGILGLTGAALPWVLLFHIRFPGHPPAESHVVIRQALWVGVYGATLAWLQLGHLVSFYVVLGLAVGLAAAEYLIRLRERARWRPPPPDPYDDAP